MTARLHRPQGRNTRLFVLMIGVFAGGGLLASIEALVVPQLKLELHIGYAEALLVQLTYYSGYLLFAWPAAYAVARLGAMRSTALGLAAMTGGCALLAGAELEMQVAFMLAALFLLSAGATVLQIACNGLMATHGGPRAVSRFTLLQAFNAVGTTVGPAVGATFLLGDGSGSASALVFLAFAGAFGALAAAFTLNRALLRRETAGSLPSLGRLARLMRQPRMARGVGAIFAYVGAEVAIGTLAVSYLMLPDRGHVEAVTAGRLLSLYWGGAMIGRFAGAWALRRLGTTRLLSLAAGMAFVLMLFAIGAHGLVAASALLAVGLCNSIMFPTIYSVAMPREAGDMPAAAMLLCMAVVGGAVVPILTGIIADRTSLPCAFLLPLACYLAIGFYAYDVGQREQAASLSM